MAVNVTIENNVITSVSPQDDVVTMGTTITWIPTGGTISAISDPHQIFGTNGPQKNSSSDPHPENWTATADKTTPASGYTYTITPTGGNPFDPTMIINV